MASPISIWTKEREAVVARLWADGRSAREIAIELGGTTRNAIIGKINRLDLPKPEGKIKKSTNPIGRKRLAKRSTASHDVMIHRIVRANSNSNQMRVLSVSERAQYKIRCVEIEPLNKSLLDLEKNDCRYAYGDGPFLFCGHPVKDGSSYCILHHHLCWVAPLPVRDRAPLREVA